MTVHYCISNNMPHAWACDATFYSLDGLIYPTDKITCPKCLNSEIFKQDLIVYEIGFERDNRKWREFWFDRNKNGSNSQINRALC